MLKQINLLLLFYTRGELLLIHLFSRKTKTNIHKRSGLEHLTKKIPNWMWVSAEKVVIETEKASIKGKSSIIPGFLYRITSIFFNLKITKLIWKTLNARK